MPKCQTISFLSTSGYSGVVLFKIASPFDKFDYQNKIEENSSENFVRITEYNSKWILTSGIL